MLWVLAWIASLFWEVAEFVFVGRSSRYRLKGITKNLVRIFKISHDTVRVVIL